MKLQFRILRIDDDRKSSTSQPNLQRQKGSIESYLKKNHFLNYIEIEDGSLEIDETFKYESKDYDLFIVDFNIGSKQGFEYIERIRKHSIHTDIIFYSQNPIEDAVRNYLNDTDKTGKYKHNFLQGVFLAKREELSTRFAGILDIIDEKVNNLSSMRGLVLAETADLDYILCEIIDKYFDKIGISKIGRHLPEKTRGTFDFSSQRNFSFPNPDPRKLNETFVERLNQSYNEIYCEIIYNTNSSLYTHINTNSTFINKVQEYRQFYKDTRNNLAHGKTEQNTDGTMSANGVTYSISQLKNMRKQLLEFRACFESFRDSI